RALSSPDTDVQWGAHELLWSLEEYRNPEDPSLDHLEAWIALNPEAVMAKYELALVECKRQNFDRAAALLEGALDSIVPDTLEEDSVQFIGPLYAKILRSLGRPEDAQYALEDLQRRFPRFAAIAK